MKKTIFSLAAVSTIMAATTVTASAEEIVVKKGDTLWGISQEHGVSVEHIKQQNELSSNLIFPNQSLSINEKNESKANQTSANKAVHTVKSGDTLWSIGQEHGVSVGTLKSINGLDSNLIVPGQKLSLQGSAEQKTQTSAKDGQNNESAEQTSKQSDQDNVAKTLTMEATAYTANCEGCSGTTATGINLNANPDRKVIAVDPDVIPLGTEVYVEGYGKAIAGDVGGSIQGNRIDVFIPNQSDALDFGRKTVEVTVYE